MDKLLQEKRQDILRIAAQYGARNVRVFGSTARGEAGPDSDVDFLVELDADTSLLDYVALVQDLEHLLGRKVQIATEDALHWYIRERVLEQAVSL